MSLDPKSPLNLQAQLTGALRKLILSPETPPDIRLPPTRKLAEELSVSRTTVQGSYDQLISEGYLVARQGSGTFVADNLPHLAPPPRRQSPQRPKPQGWPPFHPGVPDQTLFPHDRWARHLERAWRRPDPALLAPADPFGWYPLRTAIADHLSAWRGLNCAPEQIVITSGAWEAFDLIYRGVFGGEARAAVEDPGWPILREALAATGTTTQVVPVDADGLDPERLALGTSSVVITPSRHFPTGVTMPLPRRAALLDWARTVGGMIIEDDYDGEFRYKGQPLPSLAGLDGLRHTIYLGSFSKLLSPALRLGYMVAPEQTIAPLRAYLRRVGARASLTPQPALATFLESGEFAVHLRRMRRVYAKRQAHLVEALTPLAPYLDIAPDPSGMHLFAPLHPSLARVANDQTIEAAAREAGLGLRALSPFSNTTTPPQGLLLGYAAFDEDTLSRAADTLREVIARLK